MAQRKSKNVNNREMEAALPKLTFLPMPPRQPLELPIQLGMFDRDSGANISRAMDYINPLDQSVVNKSSARIAIMVKCADEPDHELAVMLAAKDWEDEQYLYKIYSNVKEINDFGVNWCTASLLPQVIKDLSNRLDQFDHDYRFHLDYQFMDRLGLSQSFKLMDKLSGGKATAKSASAKVKSVIEKGSSLNKRKSTKLSNRNKRKL